MHSFGESMCKIFEGYEIGDLFITIDDFVVNANVFSQQTRVTLDIKQRSVSEIISELRQVFDYRFLFKGEDLEKVERGT